MIFKTLKNLFLSNSYQKLLQKYQETVEKINHLEADFITLSDEELKNKTLHFKKRLTNNETLDDILPEAFAVVREASKRCLNMRHFDVQLIGAMILHEGKIAEMKTGEGKTLMSTLAAYLNALSEKGVFIVTVNDYLAERDSQWMGKVFNFLGLSVGLIKANMDPPQRKVAYEADITYGTNNEFGFDYLRDNLCWDKSQLCQSQLHYAIIDEVDSILIDEARTPLIISGPVKDKTSIYKKIAKCVKKLDKDKDFVLEEKHKNVSLNDPGIEKLEQLLKVDNLYSTENMELAHMSVQCLKALYLFKKDVDYVVKNNEIQIVDEFTGRLMEGRRFSDGLHQAIEALENVKIKEESQTLASITFQNYFRNFDKLAGMTGTAVTEAIEFENIYNLAVVCVPTHKPMIRKDQSDIIYKNKDQKHKAITEMVKELHQTGQPILLGTISIDNSEILSKHLKKAGIAHHVLNAKHHQQEAQIISKAGQKGSVTIATNMAGRGTDIVLGEGVKELGGLMVIGAGRHESRRIDNQLRGRAGRQGDPGASRFFVSLEDDLMRLFGSDRIAKIMNTLGLPDDTPIEHGMISRSIEKAQSKVEKYHFSIRKQILQYDDVMTQQRQTIYTIRRRILLKENLDGLIKEYISQYIDAILPQSIQEETNEEFMNTFKTVFGQQINAETLNKSIQSSEEKDNLCNKIFQTYQTRKNHPSPEIFEEIVSKQALLSTLDRRWMDHLYNMDILREGIGLRAWGQKDPLIEYKKEAFDLFSDLLIDCYHEALSIICKAVIVEEKKDIHPTQNIQQLDTNTNTNTNSNEANFSTNTSKKLKRNDKVTIKSPEGDLLTLKWKEAEEKISLGWKMIGGPSC